MTTKRVLLISSVSAGLVACVYWLVSRPLPADVVVRRACEAIASADWAELYAHCSEEERLANDWTEEKFVRIMRSLAPKDMSSHANFAITELDPGKTMPPEVVISNGRTAITQRRAMWDTDKVRRFEVKYPAWFDQESGRGSFTVEVGRSADGQWRVIGTVCFAILTYSRSASREERAIMLADALDSAGLRKIVYLSNQFETGVEQLRAFAKGDITLAGLTKPIRILR